MTHQVGQRDLRLVHADGVAHLTVHDLEVEALEYLGRRAVERNSQPVQMRVVEHRLQRQYIAGRFRQRVAVVCHAQRVRVIASLPAVDLQHAEVGADQPRALRIEAHCRNLAGLRIGQRGHAGDGLLHRIGGREAGQRDVLAHRQQPQVEILVAVAGRRGRGARLARIPLERRARIRLPEERPIERHHHAAIFAGGLIADVDAVDAREAQIDRADRHGEADLVATRRGLVERVFEREVRQRDRVQETPWRLEPELRAGRPRHHRFDHRTERRVLLEAERRAPVLGRRVRSVDHTFEQAPRDPVLLDLRVVVEPDGEVDVLPDHFEVEPAEFPRHLCLRSRVAHAQLRCETHVQERHNPVVGGFARERPRRIGGRARDRQPKPVDRVLLPLRGLPRIAEVINEQRAEAHHSGRLLRVEGPRLRGCLVRSRGGEPDRALRVRQDDQRAAEAPFNFSLRAAGAVVAAGIRFRRIDIA